MRRAGLRRLPGLPAPRWLRWALGAASTSLLAAGCGSLAHLCECTSAPDRPAIATTHPPLQTEMGALHGKTGDSQLVQASYMEPSGPELAQAGAGPVAPKPLPIDLETVLRLAEEHNPQIAVSREKVHASLIEGEGSCNWMPKVYAGVAYYRHEGGTQNPDGTFVSSSTGAVFPGLALTGELDPKEVVYKRVSAERQIWQDKGELCKISTDQLLEAATTYIDLLTARQAQAVSCELERYAQAMLTRAEKLREKDVAFRPMVEAVQTEVLGRQQNIIKLKQQGDAAAIKLAYLLGLPCDALLCPVAELAPAPIDVVDVGPPCAALVALALSDGPGIKEIQGMLATIQCGMAQLEGPISLLPVLSVLGYEGGYGGGPRANLTWDNRFDVFVAARWNLTELLQARHKQCLAHSRLMQVELTYQEPRAKLTAGVQEAREAILAGRPQMGLGAQMIQHASESYRISEQRVKENVPGAMISEVMTAIRALEQAHHGYLSAISAYNKAQVRLLLLLGPGAPRPPKVKLPEPALPMEAPKPARPEEGPKPIKEVSLQPVPTRQ